MKLEIQNRLALLGSPNAIFIKGSPLSYDEKNWGQDREPIYSHRHTPVGSGVGPSFWIRHSSTFASNPSPTPHALEKWRKSE
jgi:hypothetical protein